MALAPRDVPITRELVHGWLQEWLQLSEQPDLKTYIAGKINALELSDTTVDTTNHDDLENDTSILDMVMADLPSYDGFSV